MSKLSRSFILSSLALTALLFLWSLVGRIIHVDEPVLAEPTYWLAQNGYLRSELLRGWQGAEEHFLFTHKLYLYVGSLFVKAFGWSAYSVKAVSLAYLFLLLILWSFIFRRFQISRIWLALFILLLLTNAHIFEFAFVYRPEVAVAAFATACFLALDKYGRGNQLAYLLLAGATAALAIGHHLNGVIVPGAGCILLISRRKILPMIGFGAIASLGFLFYLLEVTSVSDLQKLVSQFKHMQDLGPSHFSVFNYFWNILYEQQRFLHSPKEIGFTLLFVVSVFLSWKFLIKNYRDLLIYAGAGAFFLAVIAHGKSPKYLVLFLPFMIFLITVALTRILNLKKKIIVPLLVIYMSSQWIYNSSLTFHKETRTRDYAQIGKDLPAGEHILGPVYAAYWAVPTYRFQSFIAYQFRAAHKHFEMTVPALEAALDEYQINAVVFDEEFWNTFAMSDQGLKGFTLRDFHDGENKLWLFVRD